MAFNSESESINTPMTMCPMNVLPSSVNVNLAMYFPAFIFPGGVIDTCATPPSEVTVTQGNALYTTWGVV